MPVHMVSQFVCQHGFNLIRAVILQKRVGKNNAACGAQPGKSRISLLRRLGKLPLVYAANRRACPFPQLDQPPLQLVVIQWREFIENGKQNDRRYLRHQYKQRKKNHPRDQPPALGRKPNRPVHKFNDDCRQGKTKQKRFGLVPQPRAQGLVGEVVSAFQAKSKELQPEAHDFANREKRKNVERNREIIIAVLAGAESKVAQP